MEPSSLTNITHTLSYIYLYKFFILTIQSCDTVASVTGRAFSL